MHNVNIRLRCYSLVDFPYYNKQLYNPYGHIKRLYQICGKFKIPMPMLNLNIFSQDV